MLDGENTGADEISRAGEASTVDISRRRCPRCGGRLQSVVDRYGSGRTATHCRGCGKRLPA